MTYWIIKDMDEDEYSIDELLASVERVKLSVLDPFTKWQILEDIERKTREGCTDDGVNKIFDEIGNYCDVLLPIIGMSK